MDLAALIAKYDRRVPRYTSYPTAPHFSAGVTAETYAGWLRDLAPGTPLSLYLHVPFCDALCRFCACHTSVVHRLEPLIAYGQSMLAEIDLVADAIGSRLPVRHVHWGGGTPTTLPPDTIRAVMHHLRQRFDVAPDAEIAVEIDPRTLSETALAALADIGVTRASLGVQDFDPLVQQTVNRIQPFEMTADCAARLRRIGIGSINLDLVYGLPHQTARGVTATMQQAMQIHPDRVAVFGYAHVPWMKRQQALLPEHALPGPFERFVQSQTAADVIRDAGFRPVGLDHFARHSDELAIAASEGTLKRNFQGYTTDDAPVLLGFGASSIGSLPDGYVQNAAAVPAWRDSIRDGRLPIARGIALSPDDRLRRDIIEQIMCHLSVDLQQYPSILSSALPALAEQEQDGLIEWEGSRLSVTRTGRPFLRAVAAAFDAYLAPGTARHSATV